MLATAVPVRTGLAEETSVVVVPVAAGAWAIVNAVTWSPLAKNSRPPPALGLAKCSTGQKASRWTSRERVPQRCEQAWNTCRGLVVWMPPLTIQSDEIDLLERATIAAIA